MEHNAAGIPELTKSEKERMFSMSINKYNSNINNNNENGEEVKGVDRYTGHTWQKYAAVAAAFVLLAGGIGGSVALGKHMSKNSKPGTAAAAEVTSTSITSVIEAATAADDSHAPADLDAFAQEWIDNYNVWLKIPNGAVQHEKDTVSFKMAEGTYVDKVDAWKITDEEYCSADAINEHLHAFWAPGSKADIEVPDLTEKIDSQTAEYTDFTKSIYFTYKNELYRTAGNAGVEGTRTSPSAEKLNNNEILVHWNLGWEGVTVPQTMHIVWVDELNDWRVDDIVDGSEYPGNSTETAAK